MRTADGRTEPWGAGPARKAKPGQAKSRESIAQASVPGKTEASLKSFSFRLEDDAGRQSADTRFWFFSLAAYPPLNCPTVGGMQTRWLALLLPALARSEDYVAFKALSNTNLPPARALSATVLQHTVSANAALGRCVPSVA